MINGSLINKDLLWKYVYHLHGTIDLETPDQWTTFDGKRRKIHDEIYKSAGIDRYSTPKDNVNRKTFDEEFNTVIELIVECSKCHKITNLYGICPGCKEHVTLRDKLKSLEELKKEDIASVLNWVKRDLEQKRYNKLAPDEQKRLDTLYGVQKENIRLYTMVTRAFDDHPNDVFLKNAKMTIGDRGRHIDSLLDDNGIYDGND